jgi:uncharacterized membrane protein
MNKLLAAVTGTMALFPTGLALAQDGTMMGGDGWRGWMGGYGGMNSYGGILVPILLVVVIAGLVVWVVKQKSK